MAAQEHCSHLPTDQVVPLPRRLPLAILVLPSDHLVALKVALGVVIDDGAATAESATPEGTSSASQVPAGRAVAIPRATA